ncbi:helix-turn-helix transcriptional regulator [Pseudoalteromonas sp. S3431]|uniref:helix-turn-helix transcriptional regulator n=1 Tax=Pseudoalteromonas sp. S3431 TaxID=579537 RepID=UPI00049F3878|nr:helix-turn-helix domain-containing protein [Pseudoalteromonas sp. S3431]KDC54220.1 transcriptional regulator [Pseudoalteromonas sp. S3431]
MYYTELNWDIFLRTVIPFAAANIFIMVLIYFTLVRERIGDAYPFYCAFIICFILFLCGPIINVMPLNEGKRWYDFFRNILLFSIGIPCLLYALLTQAKLQLPKPLLIAPVILGIAWSCFFLCAAPLYFYSPNELPWLVKLENINAQHIYSSQLLLISVQLLLPCILLLQTNLKAYVATHVYGALTLSVFMCIGNAFELWVIYYVGASLSALIWSWAVYNDIQFTNDKIKQHTEHQNALAIAQFTAANNRDFSQYYLDKLNKAYPLKERADLLEIICTANPHLTATKLDELLVKLKIYCDNSLSCYQIRAKEIAFMIFDKVIFHCGNSKALLGELENIGNHLDDANTIINIDSALHQVITVLHHAINQLNSNTPDMQLVDKVKAYIIEQYHHDISIADIVSAVGASRSHTMKIFKQLTATTINQCLADVRINQAKLLLLTKTVTETAYAVGFNNSAYFSTVFKKHTELSPKEYQQQCQLKSSMRAAK